MTITYMTHKGAYMLSDVKMFSYTREIIIIFELKTEVRDKSSCGQGLCNCWL